MFFCQLSYAAFKRIYIKLGDGGERGEGQIQSWQYQETESVKTQSLPKESQQPPNEPDHTHEDVVFQHFVVKLGARCKETETETGVGRQYSVTAPP